MFWEAGKVAVVHSHRPLAHCSRGTPPYSQNALTYYVPLRILTATSLRVITSAPPYPRTPPHNALTHPASACPIRIRTVTCPSVSLLPRQKLDARLPGKGNSNSHGARPFRLIITMIKWIRTSRSSKKKCLALLRAPPYLLNALAHPASFPAVVHGSGEVISRVCCVTSGLRRGCGVAAVHSERTLGCSERS
jgi:hypothetical protein